VGEITYTDHKSNICVARDISEKVEVFFGFFSSVFVKKDYSYFDKLPSFFCKNAMPLVLRKRFNSEAGEVEHFQDLWTRWTPY
jgi:hypothetical protein